MAYVRKKRLKGHDYYYLVESYRCNGKVKTRTLKYLGISPEVPDEYKGLLGPGRKQRSLQQMLWDHKNLGDAIAQQVMRGPNA